MRRVTVVTVRVVLAVLLGAVMVAWPVPPESRGAVGITATASWPPPAGSIYYGASEDSDVVLAGQVGHPLGIDREYFSAGSESSMAAYAAAAAARGSVPLVSIKPPSPINWRAVAAGKHDAWVRGIIARLTAIGKPVLWSIHHEPENDTNGSTLTAATFKAMNEHVTAMHDPAGLVRFGPILMSGKYNPIPTPNPRVRLKVQDWASATSGHFLGFDAYNHFDPSSGKPWRTVANTVGWIVDGGTFRGVEILGLGDIAPALPLVWAEYGVREDPATPGRASAWLTEAYDWCLAHDVDAMSYFSSAQNVNDGGGTWKLTGPRLATFDTLIHRPTSLLVGDPL